jgi:amino acid transporter
MTSEFTESALDRDDRITLQNLGYKQQLYRGLDGFMVFALGYSEVSSLICLIALFTFGLSTGGPVTMIWGWILSAIMTNIVGLCLAEICSAYPSAGAVYYWSSQLAPREWAPFWSYWTGIFNWFGNAAGDASAAYTFAMFLNATLVVCGSTPLSEQEEVLVSVVVLFLWSIMNYVRIDKIGWINNFSAILQVTTVILIVAVVLSSASHLNKASFVFFDYNNDTGFRSQVYVAIISILFSLYGLSGYEASSHMAEETHNARVNASMAIVYTCLAASFGGMALLLGLLYGVQSISGAINGSTGNAAYQILVQTTHPTALKTLAWLLVVNAFLNGLSSVSITGRITFALFRDKAAPFHSFFGAVDEQYKSPFNAIMLVFLLDALLVLLLLNSVTETAFTSLVSMCTFGFQVSYVIPIALKYFMEEPEKFPKTPISLGRWSSTLGLASIVWLSLTSLVFLFPTVNPVTASSMNYSCVVLAGILFFAALNWELVSKHSFTGPKRRTDSQEHASEITALMSAS